MAVKRRFAADSFWLVGKKAKADDADSCSPLYLRNVL